MNPCVKILQIWCHPDDASAIVPPLSTSTIPVTPDDVIPRGAPECLATVRGKQIRCPLKIDLTRPPRLCSSPGTDEVDIQGVRSVDFVSPRREGEP